MKTISYVSTDVLGIHASPAVKLVKQVTNFASDIQISSKVLAVDAKRIMSVMMLALKQGMEITITISGDDEEQALEAIETFLKENL